MKHIDLEHFPRRSHYEFFKSYAYPYMGMTANVDVTNLYNAAKKMGGSPFLAFLWAAATAANSVPELRQRMVGEGIVEYDHCDTAHTVALPDGTFVNCRTDCRRSFAAFQTYGKQCQEEAKQRHGFVQPGDDETELIFVSSTPWVTFTQVIQPTPIPADSNVRIVFGKFFDQNGRKMLPVNIQCNHALVDGLHVGQFYQKFQELADSDLTVESRGGYDPSVDYGKYPTFAPLRKGIRTSAQGQKADWRNNVLRSDELPGYISSIGAQKCKVFRSQYLRKEISSVTFLDTLRGMPDDAWDVSEAGNRSVMAWVKPNDALYDLYIGAEGGMRVGKDCSEMFVGYVNAERISFGTVLHTEGVENMRAMFYDCESLSELDLSGFDTAKVWDMSSMFYGCNSLTELDLSSFDTSGVKNMHRMFYNCKSFTRLNLSSFNTSGVKSMHRMFYNCTSLTELDLSGFDTSWVQDMSSMFSSCESLTKLDLRNFDTSGVQDMGSMFYSCTSLTELDLSSFDASAVQKTNFMFKGCTSLTKLELSSFDASRVQSMYGMFDNCPAGSKWQHLVH